MLEQRLVVQRRDPGLDDVGGRCPASNQCSFGIVHDVGSAARLRSPLCDACLVDRLVRRFSLRELLQIVR
ncbi:MAG: hypothetical protein L0K86_29120 [Actinomycetia bacterium]|nr:hypothetical protein [Actinomycetes bacterium]